MEVKEAFNKAVSMFREKHGSAGVELPNVRFFVDKRSGGGKDDYVALLENSSRVIYRSPAETEDEAILGLLLLILETDIEQLLNERNYLDENHPHGGITCFKENS
jgi:hypothetical protein